MEARSILKEDDAPTASALAHRYPVGHGVNLEALRAYRLQRVRDQLRQRDVAACLLFDPINIRYATDVTNMQVWTLHNPARYLFVPVEGPVVLAGSHARNHVAYMPNMNWFGGYGEGLGMTPEQQHQAFLSRLLLMLGSFVIMCLLLF